ncbi:MAG: hypothetical protein M3348_07385, partial [Acidobacteriota bacterium]|nr:hypothetical protein [Acidobacteriota bacterium]
GYSGRVKLLLTILLCLSPPALKAARGSAVTERLPRAVRAALDARFPGWRFAEAGAEVRRFFAERFPGARPDLIKGDFDGDGRTDFALLIEHGNFERRGVSFERVVERLAFLKRGTGYRLYSLERSSPADPELYLTLARKGAASREFRTGRRFKYPHDSISVSHFEKAGGTYVYRRGRFHYVYESD